MLDDKSISKLVDFSNATDCFPSVEIKGGICYYLMNKSYNGKCSIVVHHSTQIYNSTRYLRSEGVDAFVRFPLSLSIVEKIQTADFKPFSNIVSSQNPFGFNSKVVGKDQKTEGDIAIISKFRNVGYINPNEITLRKELVDRWKVMTPIAGEGGTLPHRVTGRPFVSKPGECCNGTYMVIGPFNNRMESENVVKYLNNKFPRFMISVVQNTQNTKSDSYRLVPLQDFSKPWTDADLYAKYGLTEDEIAFIESMIKPME
jgi:site-specific DNA-methyltransferase (adenine-specific)